MQDKSNQTASSSRRTFLKTTGTTLAAAAVGVNMAYGREFIQEKDRILKVGLIGCGGRGTGAAVQALNADSNVRLTAMGDIFEDHLNKSYAAIKEEVPGKVDVADDHKFIGFDAYQKVIDSGVDVVLLTTPPVFRPSLFEAAIAAGKHVFCEKPRSFNPTEFI